MTRRHRVAALSELPHVAAFSKQDADFDLGHLVEAAMNEGKQVAAAHGGSVEVGPAEEGGARFRLHLPAAPAGARAGEDAA